MGIDISQLGKDAQAQVMAKMAVQEVKKRSKYGNRKVVRDGIKFDSEREAARFGELKVLRAMGKIRDLRLQVNFTLVEGYTTIEGKRIKPMVYRADFTYERVTEPDCNGTVRWLHEVEDVKGMKTKDYLLKKKLMQDKYGITIREV
jgi:hypothetical protein|nr:MAG TPA: Endonuclease [Caudoviricetes sp.]